MRADEALAKSTRHGLRNIAQRMKEDQNREIDALARAAWVADLASVRDDGAKADRAAVHGAGRLCDGCLTSLHPPTRARET